MQTCKTSPDQAAQSASAARRPLQAGKYLTFRLHTQEYGIPITRIREIIGLMPFASVPNAPAYFRGVINLRGKIIPVVDLRLRFGMEETADTRVTCIVVIEGRVGEKTFLTGLLVDTVTEVVDLKRDQIEPPPLMGHNAASEALLGMAKVGTSIKILVDIDRVLDLDDLPVFSG